MDRYLRNRLVVPNPDKVETAKLRLQYIESKSYREFLKKENIELKAILAKKEYTALDSDLEDEQLKTH